MSSSTPDVTQSSPPPAPSTSVGNGWHMPQLSYENLNRLAKEKIWPAVDVVVAKYQENPSQTLLLATLSLLAFIPLSALVAILFLVATLAATLLMLALQITLVCSSIFIAACLSVLSLSTLSTPGIARVIEELNHARALAAGFFKPSAPLEEPAQDSASAGSSANSPAAQRRRGLIRRRVVPMLMRPKVILALIAFTIAAPPIIFLLRHVIVSLLLILLNVVVKLIIRASENFFILASLIGYIGYRFGSPSKSRTTEHTSHNMSTPSDVQNASTTPSPERTPSPPPAIDFSQLNQYRIDLINIIKPVWTVFIAGLLGSLVQAHHGLMWLISHLAEDGPRALTDERNQTSRTMDTKKSSGDEDEILPTGSSSALESRGMSPSNAQNASTTPPTARTPSPPPAIDFANDFAQLNQFRIDVINIIKPFWTVFVAGLLGVLHHVHHGLMWLINQMAEDGTRAPIDERNQTSRRMDTKRSSGDEDEGYEMLPTGSGSALEPRGESLSERKGKAKVSFEEE